MIEVWDFLWGNPLWFAPIVGLGTGLTYFLFLKFGWRGALVGIGTTIAALAYGAIRRQGYNSRVREEQRDADKTLDRANRAREQVRTTTAAPPRPTGVRPKPDPYDRDG